MALKFSYESWHAKINWFSFRFVPAKRTSLCPYFWLTVLACICVPFVALGRPIGRAIDRMEPWSRTSKARVAVALWLVWMGLWGGYATYESIINIGLWATLFWAGVIVAVVGLFIGLFLLIMWFLDNRVPQSRPVRESRPYRQPKAPREPRPSLFLMWIKAKKDKVCPIVEFEEA
jgi:hypothetical protein